MEDDLCRLIAEKYYTLIYNYCYARLNMNKYAAEDCTQETFLIMIKKKNHLNLSGNMRAWLYKTADYVIKRYQRSERKYAKNIRYEDVALSDDGGIERLLEDSCLDCLSADEKALITEYYSTERGNRKAIAARYSMSQYALYNEIDRIKQKLKQKIPVDLKPK